MHAYYEVETDIPASHRIDIQLPDTIPAGRAKIAVIYEVTGSPPPQSTAMAEFLASLPDQPSGGMSREEIRAYLDQERSSWDA